MKPLPHQKVFFTRIQYSNPYHLFTNQTYLLEPDAEVLLVCGIANPEPLKKALTTFVSTYELLAYSDHHIFNTDDLKEIKKYFSKIKNEKKIILTTEKDGVRLVKYEKELREMPVYVFPIAHEFLFGQEREFEEAMLQYVESFKRSQD